MMDSSASKDEICVLSAAAAAAVVVTIGLSFVVEPISSSSSVVKTDKPLNGACWRLRTLLDGLVPTECWLF